MMNSPAGMTTILGQRAQSLNSVSGPLTRQTAVSAERRCCGGALRRASPDARVARAKACCVPQASVAPAGASAC
jgi:hypothetical protein